MDQLKDILFNDNETPKMPFNIIVIEETDPFYVDKIADWLARELDSESSRAYYCKIARQIPKQYLNTMMVRAKTYGKNPAKLFNHLAEKYLKYMRLDGHAKNNK